MDLLWRIFIIVVNILILPLYLFLIGFGVAVWWASILWIAKILISSMFLLAGIVFGFTTIMMSIHLW